ncbi:magnesium transporter MRS2-11, chloroplastic [Tanacetum coccineum]
MVSTRKISRRDLLKSSGLRPRDIRSVDPSLWLTNTMPSLLVRENAILLNLGSLRAIAMLESVFIFNYNRRAGKAFIDALLPRLNPKNMHGGPVMPFELESVFCYRFARFKLYSKFCHRLTVDTGAFAFSKLNLRCEIIVIIKQKGFSGVGREMEKIDLVKSIASRRLEPVTVLIITSSMDVLDLLLYHFEYKDLPTGSEDNIHTLR